MAESPYTTCTISLPVSLKEDLDKRAASLRLTRTDYLRLLVLADLAKGEGAPMPELAPKPRAIGAVNSAAVDLAKIEKKQKLTKKKVGKKR
jgi:hypothetical protein